MGELARLRGEQGRAHLPFETLVGIYAKPDLGLFQSMQGTGMTAGLNMPFTYAFGGPSTLDQKRRMMEAFAESVVRHFP